MEIKNLPLKFTLLALAVALCLWSLNLTPYPGPGLLEGLDLRGGVSMTFQIETQADGTAESLSGEDLTTEMIDNLKRRLDPNGLMGLQFLPLRNNRICIRMPAAQPETLDAERLFREAIEALREGNISPTQLRHFLAIEAPGVQEARAAELAEGDEDRLARLMALVDTYNAKLAAQGVFDSAGTAAEMDTAQMTVDETSVAYLNAERDLVATNISLEVLRGNLMTNYVTPREAKLLVTGKDGDVKIAARNQALDSYLTNLKTAHPEREADIDTAVDTFMTWAKLRQTLGDPSTLKRMVAKAGVLEFRVAPFSPYFQAMDRDNVKAEELEMDRLPEAKMNNLISTLQTHGPEGVSDDENYGWFPVRDEDQTFPNIVTSTYAGRKYVLLYTRPGKTMLAQRGDDGWVLKDAKEDRDYSSGQPAVSFTLDANGKQLFARLTSDNKGRQMAILLDGEVYNAPNIRNAILQGKGQITVPNMQERPELCRTLRAGSLPAMLDPNPISENNFGPSLGQDNKEMGLRAGIWGLIAVAVFMLCYYLIAGGIANIALMVNLLLVLGFMSLFRVVLTLPGIAGLILTIGIAVDANVLIFERLREEQRKHQSPSMTIANAYRRAFSAIFDANITTLITCLILGWIGTPEVRGFAVTLGLGVLFSLFSALVVTRWLFQGLLNLGAIKEHVSMMRIIGTPKVNWIGKRYFFWAISAALIVLGIMSLSWQGASVMGIEFSSGTQATITFRDDAMLTPAGATEPELLSDGVVRAMFTAQAEQLDSDQRDKLLSTARVEERLTDRHDLVRKFMANHAAADATQITVAEWTAQDGNPAFFAALDTNTDGVMSKDELLARLPANEYQLSTTETDTRLVTQVVTDAYGAQLERQAACKYDLVKGQRVDALGLTTAPDGLTLVPDVQDSTGRDIFEGADGGVVFVIENVTPMTQDDLAKRIDVTRYQPDFVEAPLAVTTVTGLHAVADDQFDAFAIVSTPDDPELASGSTRMTFAASELAMLKAALEQEDTLEMRNFDPQIAKQARGMAVMAIILSCVAIVLYLWLRFGSLTWGIAAVVCLAHDVIIVVGLVAASGWLYETAFGKALAIRSFKIDLAMVAAFLTVIGYSVNDTIVVFDRIRENRGRSSTITPQIINRSINQTLSRTILTSMTTLIVVVIMYVWGGPGIHAFSFALLAGVIFGTYSSIAVASPLLLGVRKAVSWANLGRDTAASIDSEDAADEDVDAEKE
jgi:SecD/SecF fusion protein